jgi:hypothetical protein
VPQSRLFEDLARRDFESDEISKRLRPMLRAAKRGRRLRSPLEPVQRPTLLCVEFSCSCHPAGLFAAISCVDSSVMLCSRYCPRLTAKPWWTQAVSDAVESETGKVQRIAALDNGYVSRLERSWMRVLERAADDIRAEFKELSSARASAKTAQAGASSGQWDGFYLINQG